MPWRDPRQRAAIAADLARRGKSREEIRAFFHRHGHGGNALMEAHRRAKAKRRS